MGIPSEHTISLKDTNYEELNKKFEWLKQRIKVVAGELKNNTSIFNGLNWDDIKDDVENMEYPYNKLVINLKKDK